MNAREWVTSRSKSVPEALTAKVIEFLGEHGDVPEKLAGKACLTAAATSLQGLLASGRTERDSALDLLAIDALTTFAYEHASESPNGAVDIKQMASDGASALSTMGNSNG